MLGGRGRPIAILPVRKSFDAAGLGCHHPRAALRGLRGAVPTVLGLELGRYCWALFAGAGFAALVAASEVAFVVLRVVGAGVLRYLGFKAWRTAWRARPLRSAPTPGDASR
jgi:threonine/homoserine/homoserine lactone efflux protein